MHTLRVQQNHHSLADRLEGIIPFGARASWPSGFQLYEEGAVADKLFIMLSGRVVLRNQLKAGRGFIPAAINRGMTFGSEGLSPNGKFLSDAVATERSETLHLTAAS